VREADPPPPFVRFSGLKEILRLLLMQATSRARPFGGPLRAKHFHVALALPSLPLPSPRCRITSGCRRAGLMQIINALMPDMSQISGQQMARAETINYLIVVFASRQVQRHFCFCFCFFCFCFCFLSASPGLARVMVLLGLGPGSPMHLASVLS
jgi:hypothetical protein